MIPNEVVGRTGDHLPLRVSEITDVIRDLQRIQLLRIKRIMLPVTNVQLRILRNVKSRIMMVAQDLQGAVHAD